MTPVGLIRSHRLRYRVGAGISLDNRKLDTLSRVTIGALRWLPEKTFETVCFVSPIVSQFVGFLPKNSGENPDKNRF